MADGFYDEMRATADELLTEFGRPVVLKRQSPGSGDPWNPGAPTWTEYPATAAVLPASKGTVEAFDNRLEGGTLIDERLRYLLMSPVGLPIEPKSTDVVTFDGYDWMVLGCTPLNPAGTPVLYPMGVKR